MYSAYVMAISNALHHAGFVLTTELKVTPDELNLENGCGAVVYPTGDRYEGNWRGGRPHGIGTYVWWDGDKYEGSWAGGYKDGLGLCSYGTGEAVKTLYEQGERRGPGLKWNKERTCAWELFDGEEKAELPFTDKDEAVAQKARERIRRLLEESLGIVQEELYAPPKYEDRSSAVSVSA